MLGIVTICQLVLRTAELQVQAAQMSNPLTGLPGMPGVQAWIDRALAEEGEPLGRA